jgi:hypothetical protein
MNKRCLLACVCNRAVYIYIYVSGFEKRAHFAQNANFWHFSNCRSPHKYYKSLRLLAWFISSLAYDVTHYLHYFTCFAVPNIDA